jgi:hypothetical protein
LMAQTVMEAEVQEPICELGCREQGMVQCEVSESGKLMV